jgi:acetyl esterase/lipase
MSELFPADQPRPQPADFFDIAISMLEADPHALDNAKAMIPSTEQLIESFPALAAVEFDDLAVVGPGGPVPARRYADPNMAATGAFVWVHGGAFIFGDLDMLESHWVAMSIAARGVPVVALDYRKALNGVCFPAPSDDVLAGWRHVVDHAEVLFGVPASSVHLGGGSAGANLALGAAKRLRDTNEPMPASVIGAYGVFHAALPAASKELTAALERHPDAMRFPPELGEQMNLRFAGSETRLTDPYAFPGNGDLSGLPPVYLLNSEADDLRSSGEELGRQLAAAGVTVKVEFEPGTAHGHLNEAFDPAATRSIDRIVDWITTPR